MLPVHWLHFLQGEALRAAMNRRTSLRSVQPALPSWPVFLQLREQVLPVPAAVHCLISTTGLRVKGRTVKVPIFLPKVQEVHFRVLMTGPEVKGLTVQLLREQVLQIFPEYKVSA